MRKELLVSISREQTDHNIFDVLHAYLVKKEITGRIVVLEEPLSESADRFLKNGVVRVSIFVSEKLVLKFISNNAYEEPNAKFVLEHFNGKNYKPTLPVTVKDLIKKL